MQTIQEVYKNRKKQIENRNGTEALRQRIEQLSQLNGTVRHNAAEQIKGYIDALVDLNEMTFIDGNDWKHIVEAKLKGFN